MLIELIDDCYKSFGPRGLELMQEAAQDIRENPKMVADGLDAYITDLAIENGVCPRCFTWMAVERYTERHEVWGATHLHTTTYARCPACGWE